MSAPRRSSSSIASSCRVIVAQWIGWLDRLSPLPTSSGCGIEQLAHLLQIVIPQRQRDRLPLRRGVELRFERVRQQLLHLRVAAIACNLDRIVVHPEVQRVAIVLEQESHDVDAVLAHGEVERLAIVVVRRAPATDLLR